MRTLRVIVLVWILTDCGVALGWLPGLALGRQTAFMASIVLGTLAILLAIKVLVRLDWLNPDRRRGGSIGGLCGFAIAASLAWVNPDQPVAALLWLGIVGLSVMIGAGPSAAR